MNTLQKQKSSVMIAPIASTNGETVSANLDCKGHKAVDIIVQIGAFSGGTSGVSPLVCKIGESDDTVVTNFADITGGSAASTLVAGGSVRFNVDLTKRKRYLRLTFSPATASTNSSTVVSAIARFDNSENSPASTSAMGNTAVKIV